MTVVLGYVWGIWWWRCADSRIDVDPLRVPFSKLPTSQMKIAELRKAGLDKFRESCEMRGIPRTLPVDIVVCGDSPCPRTREVQVHRWNGFLPQWFLCGVGEDYFVCAPEFCFIMVAGNIRSIMRERVRKWQYVVALVELGCELCGMYSLQNTRRGFKDRTRPLTSSKNLYAFAGRVTHERGTSMVFAALPWVVDGMRSPMETVLYLMLCAPRKWGSLALPRPLCNVLLDVPEHLWDKTTLRHIRPDFLWPEFCLIVEYTGRIRTREGAHTIRRSRSSRKTWGTKSLRFANKTSTIWGDSTQRPGRSRATLAGGSPRPVRTSQPSNKRSSKCS